MITFQISTIWYSLQTEANDTETTKFDLVIQGDLFVQNKY